MYVRMFTVCVSSVPQVMGDAEGMEYAQGLYEYCCMNGADHQRVNNIELDTNH